MSGEDLGGAQRVDRLDGGQHVLIRSTRSDMVADGAVPSWGARVLEADDALRAEGPGVGELLRRGDLLEAGGEGEPRPAVDLEDSIATGLVTATATLTVPMEASAFRVRGRAAQISKNISRNSGQGLVTMAQKVLKSRVRSGAGGVTAVVVAM